MKFIRDVTTTPTELDKETMDQLILSYLIHHGYTSTAKAVVQNAGHVAGHKLFLSNHDSRNNIGEKDMENRQCKCNIYQRPLV